MAILSASRNLANPFPWTIRNGGLLKPRASDILRLGAADDLLRRVQTALI
jgi:hypothetical protein